MESSNAKSGMDTERSRIKSYFKRHDLATASDLRGQGIGATAIARAAQAGEVQRIGRGLYQSPGMRADRFVDFAKLSKRRPNGVICMLSALAIHGVAEDLPSETWMAIGAKDWGPVIDHPPARFVRFREPYFSKGVETRQINGVIVNVYSITKSLADSFRNPRLVDRTLALRALWKTLLRGKPSPAEIHEDACEYGAGNVMYDYLVALTATG